jgi:hypothetical protein
VLILQVQCSIALLIIHAKGIMLFLPPGMVMAVRPQLTP